MIYLLFGPPAAGKSTQGQLLSHYLGIPYVGVGSLLWQKCHDDNQIRQRLNNGELLDASLVKDVFTALRRDYNDNVILDGAIRLPDQVDTVTSLWANREFLAIEIDLSDSLIRERTRDRKTNNGKDRPYDDLPDIVDKRIATYRKNRDKVVDHLNNHGIPIMTVNGDRPIDSIQAEIIKTIGLRKK